MSIYIIDIFAINVNTNLHTSIELLTGKDYVHKKSVEDTASLVDARTNERLPLYSRGSLGTAEVFHDLLILDETLLQARESGRHRCV
jgi:hypothetical protein